MFPLRWALTSGISAVTAVPAGGPQWHTESSPLYQPTRLLAGLSLGSTENLLAEHRLREHPLGRHEKPNQQRKPGQRCCCIILVHEFSFSTIVSVNIKMDHTWCKWNLIGVKSDFIAVDWVGENLYWVDGLVGQILAVKLSNTTVRSQDCTVVLGDDLEQPSSLVLLPHKGWVSLLSFFIF